MSPVVTAGTARAFGPNMETGWLSLLHGRANALVATHGERALTAMISGFCFLLGVALAVGALAAARRALRAWRLRRCHSEVEEDVVLGGGFALATAAPPMPPPIPSRWLN